jgi:hypothetical protein
VDFEFSWMTYFVALFALMGVSLALTLLCPAGGERDDRSPPAHAADEHRPAAR